MNENSIHLEYLKKENTRRDKKIDEIVNNQTKIEKIILEQISSSKLEKKINEKFEEHIKNHDDIINKSIQTEPCKTTIYNGIQDSLDKKEIKNKVYNIVVEKNSVKKVIWITGFIGSVVMILLTVLFKKWF